MQLTSVVGFFNASKLALALLAGAVGVAAGGGLVVATTHFVSTNTQQTTANSADGNQPQAKGHGAEVTVAKCKAALPAGQHGIGKCVSAVANKHGKAASAAASANGNKNTTPDADETPTASKP